MAAPGGPPATRAWPQFLTRFFGSRNDRLLQTVPCNVRRSMRSSRNWKKLSDDAARRAEAFQAGLPWRAAEQPAGGGLRRRA